MRRGASGVAGAPRVLVCSADVGCGHGRAAAAVALAFRNRSPSIDARVIDVLTLTPWWFNLVYRRLFLLIAKYTPKLNAWLYDSSDAPGSRSPTGMMAAIESFALRRFCNSILVRRADIIVCTHFLCARVLARLRDAGTIKSRIAVVVTDQHPHSVWRVPSLDLFFVPSEAAAAEMVRNQIDPERAVVSGIPVDERFYVPLSQSAARTRHGIPLNGPVILLSGGGLGLGGLDRALEGIMSERSDVFTVVVCGHNRSLRKKLLDRYGSDNDRCRILGVTNRMHELMTAADLHVGKPGGLMTTESCAKGLPMVLLRPLPGQEERNASRMLEAGVAILHRDPYDAGRAAVKLLTQSDVLQGMRNKATHFSPADAANVIRGELLKIYADAGVGKARQNEANLPGVGHSFARALR